MSVAGKTTYSDEQIKALIGLKEFLKTINLYPLILKLKICKDDKEFLAANMGGSSLSPALCRMHRKRIKITFSDVPWPDVLQAKIIENFNGIVFFDTKSYEPKTLKDFVAPGELKKWYDLRTKRYSQWQRP